MNTRVMNGGKVSAGASHSAHNAEIALFENRSMAEVSPGAKTCQERTSRPKIEVKWREI